MIFPGSVRGVNRCGKDKLCAVSVAGVMHRALLIFPLRPCVLSDYKETGPEKKSKF